MEHGISLCMIVRDEAGNLGRCLDSVQGGVDEIVVVDTGSRDATVEVARAFGARVFRLPWPDDFSAARNRSLEEAAGEWILVLDADEELPAAAGLRKLAEAEDTEAWTFMVVSPLGEDTATRHQALRMFRNRADYRFAGLVHEQVQPSILRRDPAARIRHADLEIRHYGYGPTGSGGKTARNIRLLQKALAGNPTDPYHNYNLGVSYLADGDPARARTHFEIAFLTPEKGSGWAPSLYRNYALCLLELGEYAACLQVLDQGLGDYPAYPDLHFLKGEVFFDLGLLEQARACFLICTRVRRIAPEYTTMDGVTTHLGLENLARIALREGDPDQAADYLAAVCRLRGGAGAPTLGRVLQQKGLAGRELRQALAGYLDADTETLAGVLFDLGEYGVCLEELGPAPDQPALVLLAARSLTMAGRPAEALPLLGRLAPETPGREEVEWLARRLQDQGPVSPEAVPLVIDAAGAAWLRGDEGTALSLLGPGARLALAGWALERGRPAVAQAVLAGEPPEADVSLLRGRACAALGRHHEAALHFLAAARTGSDRKSAYAQALAEVISHCRTLVLELLKVEGKSSPVQAELFRLASREKKLGRLKGGSNGDPR